uniref:Anion exchange protein n=1 Tax=Gasterosteus aculeatus aculeatus TaxID=481459 RepID=A0AAQ4PG63_GASAC
MSSEKKMEDEAVLDRGASFVKHVCDEEEVEGHHTVYIGVHVPKSYRRRRRHRRKSSHKERRERADHGAEGYKSDGDYADESAAGVLKPLRVSLYLGEETMEMEWKETPRGWIKFEEKVEAGGERWSKPHVATLSLHSLMELKTCIEKGSILLDLEASTLPQVVELITDSQIEAGQLKAELKEKVTYTLLRRHRHQTKKSNLRSLADIGKSVSSASRLFSNQENARNPAEHAVPCSHALQPEDPCEVTRSSSMGYLCSPATSHRNLTSNSLSDFSDKPERDQLKNKFMKKLPRDAEASNVLIGEVDFLETPFVAFVRLQQAVMLGALTEVPVPTRFLFVLLGPKGKAKSYHEIGRAIATLMSDEVFHDIAYKAKDRRDLLAGIEEFLDEVIVLPPGEWDPNIRIEPPKSLPSSDKRKNMYAGVEAPQMNGDTPHDAGSGGGHQVGEELQRTRKFCGGLVLDIKRKLPFFASDFCDALHIQSLSAILFIYLGTVTNAITFGGLLGDATENMQGVLESFLGTALTGTVFCLLAGQPLTILSSTGPVLVFEKLLYGFSKDNRLDYLEFRLWIGLWSAVFCLVLVATDASFLVQYFTRFTEEGFSALISFIFIYDAFKKMLKLSHHNPINPNYSADLVTLYRYDCNCAPGKTSRSNPIWTVEIPLWTLSAFTSAENATWASLTKHQCLHYGGELLGEACGFVPDITLMSFILFFGTYTCSMTLKTFKTSRFFPTTVRKLISDFAIILTILLFCGVDAYVGVDTPKLIVPREFKPTSPHRSWFIPPFGGNPWWVYLAATIPALLVTILIFMDQQITAVIVNRKEHKLKFIPMPVLYGVFLYMGVASLNGVQFMDRLQLLLMPAKHQPDLIYLRHVPQRRIHLFTFIQALCLAFLWILKSTVAAIVFPVMILALVAVRKAMDYVFSQHDLSYLDDVIPEKDKKKKEDEKKKKSKKKGSIDSEIEFSDYPYNENIPSIKISMDLMEQEPMLGDKSVDRDPSAAFLNPHSTC